MPRKRDDRNIRKQPNGKLLVRVRRKDEWGKERTFSQVFEDTPKGHKLATVWRNNKYDQIDMGELGDKLEHRKKLYSKTLNDIINEYTVSYEFNRKKQAYTIANEVIILGAFQRDAKDLCKKYLGDLKKEDFIPYQELRLYGPDERVTVDTFKREMNPVRAALRYARQRGYDIPDIFRGFKWGEENGPRDRILKPSEYLRLFISIAKRRGIVQQRRWTAFVIVALNTGLRRGELLKIEWRDVDFTDLTLNIRKEIDKIKKGRLLPLTRNAHSALQYHYDSTPETYRTPSSKVFGPNVKVLSYMFGEPEVTKRVWGLTNSAAEQIFRRICHEANPPIDDFHIHDLRHTAATNFATLEPIVFGERESRYMLGKGRPNKRDTLPTYENIPTSVMVKNIRAKLKANEEAYVPWDDQGGYKMLPPEDIAILRVLKEEHGMQWHLPDEWEAWEKAKNSEPANER